MRQIEKHSKRHVIQVDKDGNHVPVVVHQKHSKQVRQALEKQRKQQEAEEKEALKSQREAITRHRQMQTPEVRARMDRNLTEVNKRHSPKKEFFLKQWLRPKDDIAKIEKRQAKEVEKRMAATRKKAQKTNEQFGKVSAKTTKTRKVKLPNPKDSPQGGGGTYKNTGATQYVNPANIQFGGGGSYNSGNAKQVKPSDIQHGGGGTYKEGKTKKKLFSRNK